MSAKSAAVAGGWMRARERHAGLTDQAPNAPFEAAEDLVDDAEYQSNGRSARSASLRIVDWEPDRVLLARPAARR
jgi:hypothetical protein